MADIQEKEELTQEAVAPVVDATEENVEDYFNPFADISDEDKQVEDEIKEDISKKETPQVDVDVRSELAEVKAERQASKEVGAFIKEHPEFEELSNDLVELASKAVVKGHSKPLEFAVRNVKSPSYWIDYGKRVAREDLASVSQNRVGGCSLSKGSDKGTPDFSSMSSDEFNEYTKSVLRGA